MSRFLFALVGAWLAPALIVAAFAESLAVRNARIVALAPSITELVFAAGAGTQLVAVSAWSDYPPAARSLPVVADAGGIAWERLLAAKPGLVLYWASATRPADLARLKALDIAAVPVDVRRLDDVADVIESIGRLAGTAGTAADRAAAYRQKISSLRRQFSGSKPVRVFFEISRVPLMTVNREHVIDDLLRLCGGQNVFAELPALVGEPSRERLRAARVDLLLIPEGKSTTGREDLRRTYSGLKAFNDGAWAVIPADPVLRPGPRLLEAAISVCAAIDIRRRALGAKTD
ncbi:MAG TPA: helical backbone metal receptor [Usitatibacteraceae bacterium]|nr:helical backbone metal receptor [Usitatibacteraceae bacterium]